MNLVFGYRVLKVSSSFAAAAVAFCLSKCSLLTVGRKKALLTQVFLGRVAETLALTDTLGCVYVQGKFPEFCKRNC